MKKIILTMALPLMLIPTVFGGGLPVFDAVATASARLAAERDYLEQLLHEANQQTEIFKLVEQIRQLDSYLERFGNPGEINNLQGLDELYRQLKAAPVLEVPESKKEDIQPDEVFRSLKSNLHPKLQKEITLDGKVEATRDETIYVPEVAERRLQETYQLVRKSAVARREGIRLAHAKALQQLQQATTSSEVQKISAVLTGLQTELQAVDQEMTIAAHDVQAQMLANATEREIFRKAAVQRERASLRVGTKKDTQIYQLFTTPTHFSETP